MAAISEYFGMGGYAGYVWGSYSVSAVVLIGILIASVRMLRRNQRAHDALDSTRPEANKDRTVEKKT